MTDLFDPIDLSARAWKAMQSHFAKLESSPATRIKGQARKDRTAILHAALAGGKR